MSSPRVVKSTTGRNKSVMAAGAADHVWGLEEVIALLAEQPKGRARKIGAPPEQDRGRFWAGAYPVRVLPGNRAPRRSIVAMLQCVGVFVRWLDVS